jgi:hypothetical protein
MNFSLAGGGDDLEERLDEIIDIIPFMTDKRVILFLIKKVSFLSSLQVYDCQIRVYIGDRTK